MPTEIRMPYREYEELQETLKAQKAALHKVATNPDTVILDMRNYPYYDHSPYTVSVPRFKGELEIVEELDRDYAALRKQIDIAIDEYRDAKRNYEAAQWELRKESEKKNWLQKLLGL